MIVLSGVAVNNRCKEELLRKENLTLQNRIEELETELADKYKQIEKLMFKIHAMGGRVRK